MAEQNIKAWVYRWVNGLVIDRSGVGWTSKQTDRWMNGRTNNRKGGKIDRWINDRPNVTTNTQTKTSTCQRRDEQTTNEYERTNTNERIRTNEYERTNTSTLETLYGGQFILSTKLIKPNFLWVEFGLWCFSVITCSRVWLGRWASVISRPYFCLAWFLISPYVLQSWRATVVKL